jgi:predicted HTH transcriptional regulator
MLSYSVEVSSRNKPTMIFLERPITVQHIRDVCARFNEGPRVEYKSTFDASVRAQLPKIVSSFANSQGGVLVVGVPAVNGVPAPPIEGVARPREELPDIGSASTKEPTNRHGSDHELY